MKNNHSNKRVVALTVHTHPDAKLIRLGKEWDAIRAKARQVESQGMFDKMDDLDRRILKATAQTMRGLAVQARVAAHWNEEMWAQEESGLDWEIVIGRRFIEAVLRAGGLPLPDGM